MFPIPITRLLKRIRQHVHSVKYSGKEAVKLPGMLVLDKACKLHSDPIQALVAISVRARARARVCMWVCACVCACVCARMCGCECWGGCEWGWVGCVCVWGGGECICARGLRREERNFISASVVPSTGKNNKQTKTKKQKNDNSNNTPLLSLPVLLTDTHTNENTSTKPLKCNSKHIKQIYSTRSKKLL